MKTQIQKLMASLTAALTVFSGMSVLAPAYAVQMSLKDITHIEGVRDNQLVGYGVVVGLPKTGDKSRSTQTTEASLIQNFGVHLNNDNDVRSTNAASVMVTAIVPPFAKPGDPLDVMVSSLADASSLEGGVLLMTQLKAADGEVVALAQGPLSTGGSSVDSNGSSKRTAITTSARIPNGAIIEREMHTQIGDETSVNLVLDRTDYGLATKVAQVISQNLSPARAIDGSTVRVILPDQFVDDRVAFLAKLDDLQVNDDEQNAKVVVNERTGTIVIGSNVRLLPAAVAHGGITVSVSTTNAVAQPNAYTNGQTVGVSNSSISIEKEKGSLVQLGSNATLQDLVTALNSLGATPSDLISILQALKAAGSLEATLEII